MSSLNQANLIGRLGKDPEVKYMSNGNAVCTLSLATSERWKDKTSGEMKEKTEWHHVVLYEKKAELAGQYLAKGSMVYIMGKIQTRKWQDKDGNDRYTTEIICNEMKFLGSKNESSDTGGRSAAPQGQPSRPTTQAQKPAVKQARRDEIEDDDIPF